MYVRKDKRCDPVIRWSHQIVGVYAFQHILSLLTISTNHVSRLSRYQHVSRLVPFSFSYATFFVSVSPSLCRNPHRLI